jgi:hypothetical protein
MTTLTLLTVTVLADDNGPQQTGPDFGKASPFGLIVVVLLLLGVFALVWSMNRHLKRLPKSFDETASQDGGTASQDDGTAPPAAPGADPDLATDHPADGTGRGPS